MARGRKQSGMFGNIAILLIAVAVVAVVMNAGFFAITPPPDTVSGCLSQTDGFNTLQTATVNNLNASTEYQAGSFRVVVNGDVVTTGTGTAGAELTLTALDVPVSPRSGTLYALGTASVVSAKSDYTIPCDSTSTVVKMNQPDSSQAQVKAFDSTLSNTTNGFSATNSESSATAMSAGDTRNGYLDIKAPTGSSQYGGPEAEGIFWGIDTVDSAAFKENAVSLTSMNVNVPLTEVDCGKYAKTQSVDSLDRCYVSRSIKVGDGDVRLQWTLSNNGGANAGSTSDPKLYIEDLQYFEDTAGSIKYGAHDSGGTNVGETQVTFTWDNS